MYVSAIVVAAGRGKRSGSKISKPLIEIGNRPAITYCLKVLSAHPEIKEIILVANPANLGPLKRTIKKYRIFKIKKIALGGKERRDSVACGLRKINPRADLILIHDAVRPFIDKKIVSQVIKEAKKCGAAIAAVPVKATIKEITGNYLVKSTLNRIKLWEIQTPQVFKKDLIIKAHNRYKALNVTDDAALVEKLGAKVKLVRGSYFNIKITTPEDLILAEAISQKWNTA